MKVSFHKCSKIFRCPDNSLEQDFSTWGLQIHRIQTTLHDGPDPDCTSWRLQCIGMFPVFYSEIHFLLISKILVILNENSEEMRSFASERVLTSLISCWHCADTDSKSALLTGTNRVRPAHVEHMWAHLSCSQCYRLSTKKKKKEQYYLKCTLLCRHFHCVIVPWHTLFLMKN